MKGHLLKAVMVGCLIGVGLPALAQHPVTRVVVRVPFPFYVGQHLYPEGIYSFSARPDLVVLERADGTPKARFLSNEVSGDMAGSTGRIVFRCYRYQCFLSQVWIPGRDGGQALMPPRREVEVGRRETAVYMALLGMPKP